jgi:hypothetical protein
MLVSFHSKLRNQAGCGLERRTVPVLLQSPVCYVGVTVFETCLLLRYKSYAAHVAALRCPFGYCLSKLLINAARSPQDQDSPQQHC